MHDSIIQLVLVAQHPAFSPLVLGAGVELRGRDVVDACDGHLALPHVSLQLPSWS